MRLGSTVHGLLHRALCPVITVPLPQGERQTGPCPLPRSALGRDDLHAGGRGERTPPVRRPVLRRGEHHAAHPDQPPSPPSPRARAPRPAHAVRPAPAVLRRPESRGGDHGTDTTRHAVHGTGAA
ncbi:hypothetical protein [Streptomyces sp. NBC_01268]|uniref:hypothetical protein n=1 Tax=unclassified Streptomyces TaxID=2593676 RepID=UPI002E3699A1|nr:hypothetical protein [Streptomyces sp. NBC_01268]